MSERRQPSGPHSPNGAERADRSPAARVHGRAPGPDRAHPRRPRLRARPRQRQGPRLERRLRTRAGSRERRKTGARKGPPGAGQSRSPGPPPRATPRPRTRLPGAGPALPQARRRLPFHAAVPLAASRARPRPSRDPEAARAPQAPARRPSAQALTEAARPPRPAPPSLPPPTPTPGREHRNFLRAGPRPPQRRPPPPSALGPPGDGGAAGSADSTPAVPRAGGGAPPGVGRGVGSAVGRVQSEGALPASGGVLRPPPPVSRGSLGRRAGVAIFRWLGFAGSHVQPLSAGLEAALLSVSVKAVEGCLPGRGCWPTRAPDS